MALESHTFPSLQPVLLSVEGSHSLGLEFCFPNALCVLSGLTFLSLWLDQQGRFPEDGKATSEPQPVDGVFTTLRHLPSFLPDRGVARSVL